MNKQTKYLHVAINNTPCRWKDINLYNLANEMDAEDCRRTLAALQPAMIAHRQNRVDLLKSMDAPACILGPEEKMLASAQAGKSPYLAHLTRRLKQLLE